jgi:hypothetical protein
LHESLKEYDYKSFAKFPKRKLINGITNVHEKTINERMRDLEIYLQ